jgi:hypothetical protein
MKVIITESQLKTIISNTTETLNESSHSTKILKKLLSWSTKHMGCYYTPTTNGVKLCPPNYMKPQCYMAHLSDRAVDPVMSAISKWFNSTKYDVERAFRDNRPL